MAEYTKIFANTDSEINKAIQILAVEYQPVELHTSLKFQVNGIQVMIEGDKDFTDQFFLRLREVLKESM